MFFKLTGILPKQYLNFFSYFAASTVNAYDPFHSGCVDLSNNATDITKQSVITIN